MLQMLQNVTECRQYMLQKCYRMLQNVTDCYSMLRAVVSCICVTKCCPSWSFWKSSSTTIMSCSLVSKGFMPAPSCITPITSPTASNAFRWHCLASARKGVTDSPRELQHFVSGTVVRPCSPMTSIMFSKPFATPTRSLKRSCENQWQRSMTWTECLLRPLVGLWTAWTDLSLDHANWHVLR